MTVLDAVTVQYYPYRCARAHRAKELRVIRHGTSGAVLEDNADHQLPALYDSDVTWRDYKDTSAPAKISIDAKTSAVATASSAVTSFFTVKTVKTPTQPLPPENHSVYHNASAVAHQNKYPLKDNSRSASAAKTAIQPHNSKGLLPANNSFSFGLADSVRAALEPSMLAADPSKLVSIDRLLQPAPLTAYANLTNLKVQTPNKPITPANPSNIDLRDLTVLRVTASPQHWSTVASDLTGGVVVDTIIMWFPHQMITVDAIPQVSRGLARENSRESEGLVKSFNFKRMAEALRSFVSIRTTVWLESDIVFSTAESGKHNRRLAIRFVGQSQSLQKTLAVASGTGRRVMLCAFELSEAAWNQTQLSQQKNNHHTSMVAVLIRGSVPTQNDFDGVTVIHRRLQDMPLLRAAFSQFNNTPKSKGEQIKQEVSLCLFIDAILQVKAAVTSDNQDSAHDAIKSGFETAVVLHLDLPSPSHTVTLIRTVINCSGKSAINTVGSLNFSTQYAVPETVGSGPSACILLGWINKSEQIQSMQSHSQSEIKQHPKSAKDPKGANTITCDDPTPFLCAVRQYNRINVRSPLYHRPSNVLDVYDVCYNPAENQFVATELGWTTLYNLVIPESATAYAAPDRSILMVHHCTSCHLPIAPESNDNKVVQASGALAYSKESCGHVFHTPCLNFARSRGLACFCTRFWHSINIVGDSKQMCVGKKGLCKMSARRVCKTHGHYCVDHAKAHDETMLCTTLPLVATSQNLSVLKDAPSGNAILHDLLLGVAQLHELPSCNHRALTPHSVVMTHDPLREAEFASGALGRLKVSDLEELSTLAYNDAWRAPSGEEFDKERNDVQDDVFAAGLISAFVVSRGRMALADSEEKQAKLLLSATQQKEKTIPRLFAHNPILLAAVAEHNPLACHLIDALLDENPDRRPTPRQALHHPLFWPVSLRLRFVCELAGLHLNKTDEVAQLLAYATKHLCFSKPPGLSMSANARRSTSEKTTDTTQSSAGSAAGVTSAAAAGWKQYFDSHLVVSMDQYINQAKVQGRPYDEHAIVGPYGLLAFVRNARKHVNEIMRGHDQYSVAPATALALATTKAADVKTKTQAATQSQPQENADGGDGELRLAQQFSSHFSPLFLELCCVTKAIPQLCRLFYGLVDFFPVRRFFELSAFPAMAAKQE